MRRCPRCRRRLPLEAYSLDNTRGGHQRYCKECVAEYKAEAKQKKRKLTAPQYQKEILKPEPVTTYRTRNQQEQFLLFRALTEKQKGKCPICEQDLGPKPVLHRDPKTQAVRGLLCPPCRLGLEAFDGDPVRMRRAVRYVEKS